MQDRIYEKLRNEKRRKSDNAAIKKMLTVDTDAMERLTDFSIDELENLLVEEGIANQIINLIGQGKEANVYWIEDLQRNYYALKMFRINTSVHKYNSLRDTGKLAIATGLCKREYENLNLMYEGRVRVPAPIEREEFIFLMEFLGDESGASPLLRNVDLRAEGFDPIDILAEILEQVDIMFNQAKMVHGDFSEHNIVWHEEQPWIIDVFQSERWHPHYDTLVRIAKEKALPILKRDLAAILNDFKRKYRRTYDLETVYAAIVN